MVLDDYIEFKSVENTDYKINIIRIDNTHFKLEKDNDSYNVELDCANKRQSCQGFEGKCAYCLLWSGMRVCYLRNIRVSSHESCPNQIQIPKQVAIDSHIEYHSYSLFDYIRYLSSKSDLCPRCKKVSIKDTFNALSRLDNETEICSQCGTEEAMFFFGISTLSEREKMAKEIDAGKWLPTNKYQKYLERFKKIPQ